MARKKRRRQIKLQRVTTIDVEVDQNCNFDYTDGNGLPALQHVVAKPRPGEKVWIIWWTEDPAATLTIAFKNDSPCESTKFKSRGGLVKGKVRANAACKPYDYTVVYTLGGKTCTDDPQIIIN
jgi:hypothetical protein